MKKIGVLSFHGDVIEHILAARKAAKKLKLDIEVVYVRTQKDLDNIGGLIIPGGESTTLYKLCLREQMWQKMKNLPYIFGTCAGAIMMAKKIYNQEKNQKTLGLMDIEIDRNAYGRQTESFETPISTVLGVINAVFIRAPKIKNIGKGVKIMAKLGKEVVACEQKTATAYFLAACFHPELTSTLFHQYFLQKIYSASPR